MISDADYCIRYIDMPCSIKAFTVEDSGFYSIYVNSKLNCEQNYASIRHELEHIHKDDFYNPIPVDELEKLRHCATGKRVVNI